MGLTATLSTYALTTRENLLAVLARDKRLEDGDDALAVFAVNAATAEMDRFTARRLAERVYGAGAAGYLIADGWASSRLYAPECPLTALTAAAYFDDAGTWTALDITGARLEAPTGRIFLLNDVFPQGEQNIRLSCTAGYKTTDMEWSDLERLCLRLSTIIFQDLKKQFGRVVDASLLGESTRVPSFELPADVAAGLKRYARYW